MFKNALKSVMNTEVLALPDYSGMQTLPAEVDTQGNDLEPEKMSPMESLMAIFEDMRDSLSEIVVLLQGQQPDAGDLRDMGVSDADVPSPDDKDSQGNSEFEFPKLEMPEVGPKLGLALMLAGLTALFAYGDEIAKAIEPLIEAGDKVIEKLGVKGTLYTGLGLLAAIKFSPALLTLLGSGAKSISAAFTVLTSSFTAMKTFVMTTAPNALAAAYGGAKGLVIKAFDTLKTAFTAMRLFVLETLIPKIASAYGGAKGKLMSAITKLGSAFTAMRLFLIGTMIPTITAFMAPFIVPLALLTAAVAAAVAIFTSIKAGIDEFKKSLDEGDSMLVAIIEGVSTALLTLVTLPVTLIKNFVAWVAEKLGFEGIAEKLREFSIVDFIKDGIKGLVLKAKDFVLGLFDIDFRAVLGKFVDIGKSIGRVLKGIALGSIAAVKAAFPGGESPMEAFKRVYDEVSNKGNDTPALPDEADPEADSTVKTMEEVRKEEIKANEAEIDKLEAMDEDTLLPDGHTAESKIFELEERNGDLLRMIYDSQMIQADIAERSLQLQMENQGTVITNVSPVIDNSTSASSTNNLSNNDLSLNGGDATARALSKMGYAEADF